MRELHECKAEIFRRSKKRMKVRKQRMLACCIPLMICFAVCSAIALIPGRTADAPMEYMDSVVDKNASGSLICPYNEIVIHKTQNGFGDTRTITDQAEISKIFCTVQSFCGDILYGGSPESIGEITQQPEQDMDSSVHPNGYTIIFITEDGSETIYTLENNELRNVRTNSKVILTDARAATLKTLLGISEQ